MSATSKSALPSAPSSTAVPSRRTLFLGAGGLAAALAAGIAPAQAATKLRKGDKGKEVTDLQNKLSGGRYWCGSADGSFGHVTQQAVYALQKAAGLERDGVVGPKTRAALSDGVLPKAKVSGTALEIDIDTQLLLAVSKGKIRYVLNTSTGSGEKYYSGGRWKTASTPTGDFELFRFQSSGWVDAPLGRMYKPGYFYKGWAIHGSTSIPTYPASHGCARISTRARDRLRDVDLFGDGLRVLVH